MDLYIKPIKMGQVVLAPGSLCLAKHLPAFYLGHDDFQYPPRKEEGLPLCTNTVQLLGSLQLGDGRLLLQAMLYRV